MQRWRASLPSAHGCRCWSWTRCSSLRVRDATRKRAYSSKAQASRAELPKTPARTRFAPSPTGDLHLGSLRTALYNYLLAKATRGQFLLRIEDTDQKRLVPGSEDRIYRDLRWAGLDWDEGPEIGGPYGPYKQSERLEIYQRHIKTLIKSGHAYRCFCNSEKVASKGQCKDIEAAESAERAAQGETASVRLILPEKYPSYHELVYGLQPTVAPFAKGGRLLEQPGSADRCHGPVLMKSDNYPTYGFANVVDDHEMRITHVIRANDWLTSTGMHVYLYHALGWTPPAFAHVCLLARNAGEVENLHGKNMLPKTAPTKLSKRNMDDGLLSYQEQGADPQALLNFLALLGWTHGSQNDKLGLNQLIERFDLRFTRNAAVVSFSKFDFLQQQYSADHAAKQTPRFQIMVDKVEAILQDLAKVPGKIAIPKGWEFRDYVAAVLREDARSFYPPTAWVSRNQNFFLAELKFAHDDWYDGPDTLGLFDLALEGLNGAKEVEWERENLTAKLTWLVKEITRRHPPKNVEDVAWPKKVQMTVMGQLRHALAGSKPGPPLSVTLELLGKRISLQRLEDRRAGAGVRDIPGRLYKI